MDSDGHVPELQRSNLHRFTMADALESRLLA
jgi:hypothetical protein